VAALGALVERDDLRVLDQRELGTRTFRAARGMRLRPNWFSGRRVSRGILVSYAGLLR